MRWSKLGGPISRNDKKGRKARLGMDVLLEDRTVINDVFNALAPVTVGVAAFAAITLVPARADDGGTVAGVNPNAGIHQVDRRDDRWLPSSAGEPFTEVAPTEEVSFTPDVPAPSTTQAETLRWESGPSFASPTINFQEGLDAPLREPFENTAPPPGDEINPPLDPANPNHAGGEVSSGSSAVGSPGTVRNLTVTASHPGAGTSGGGEAGDSHTLMQMVSFANAMQVNATAPASAGQSVGYVVQSGDVAAQLTQTAAILMSSDAPENAVAFRYVNANPTATMTPMDISAAASTSASHDAVYYHDLYRGVDMVYQGNASNPVEYSFLVAPNVDPARIAMEVQGAQSLALDPQGNLVMNTSAGSLTSSAPVMYQMVNGVQQSVQGSYVLQGDTVGFQVGAYDHSQSLVIDPVVTATFTGIPADRLTQWTPGLMAVGGIPNRTTVFTTINASTYGNGAVDASAAIQAAVDACPAGEVVQLSAGNFTVNNAILIHSGITLRGAGAGVTILTKTNGAHARTSQIVPGTSVFAPVDPGTYSYDAQPVIIIGPSRWPGPDNSTSQNLTADGAQGAMSITVANASGFAAGQIVLLDELSGATWQPTPTGFGSGNPLVWEGDRVAWNMHDPVQQFQDDNANANANGPYDSTPGVLPDAMSWFSRTDRPTSEIKEIASVSGNTITFTSPLHISYRTSHVAQLTRYTATGSSSGGNSIHVENAGVEAFTVKGGADGQIRFEDAAYCWAKNIENTQWLGEGFAVDNSFRIEIRDSYIHTASWPEPGGAGYAISFADGSSEVLVENCIIVDACKLMVDRSAGAGSVFGYNYTDDSWDYDNPGWVEVGLNASHMAGPHHVLFEGNYSPNADSDYTHGNAIDLTFFRNWLSGQRRDFTDTGNVRVVGLAYGSWYDSFVGNVLGRPGQMSGWVYEDPAMTGNNANWRDEDIWKLGYDPERWGMYADPKTLSTVIRDGNYDYLTNSVHWSNTPGGYVIPDSLYLPSKPAFFGTDTWPWVDPTGATQIYALPAKQRYDAGRPNDTTPPSALAAPANLTATPGNAQVSLSWTGSSGAASYNVYRWNGSSFALLQNVTGTSFTNTGLTNGTTYQYQVTAVNSSGESPPSNSASATPLATVVAPTITQQPASQTVTAGQAASFTAAATGTPTPTVQWQLSSNGGSTWSNIAGATATTYSITSATGQTGNQYRAVFTNSAGSATSNAAILTVNAASQAPTFVQVGANQTGNGSNSVTLGSPAKAGDTIVVEVDFGGSASFGSITDNQGNTYVQIGTQQQSASFGASSRLYYATNIKGGALTITSSLSGSPSFHELYANEYSGVNTASPLDGFSVNVGTGSTFTSNNLTTAGANDLLFGIEIDAGVAGASAGWTPRSTYDSNIDADRNAPTAGTYAFTGSSSGGSIAWIVALKPVGGVSVTPPAITTQPANVTVTAGQPATFSVAATGTSPLNYQWRKLVNGTWTNISGATAASFALSATAASDAGSYSVVVTNPGGSTVSNTATLTVNAAPIAPSITTQPASKTVNAGQAASFTVVATGTAPLSYQWQKQVSGTWTNISGATAATYTINSATTANAGSYRVVVTNPAGSATSNTATLTVNSAVVGTGTGLTGQYYKDQTLTTLGLTRTDPTVNFNWGSGSPDPSIPVDHFSARWTGQVQAQYSETYTFYTESDDGVRLWVNGQLLINNWTDHAPTENSATISLVAGQKYDIKMEYYENGGGAVAQLLWSSPSTAKQAVPTSQLYAAASATPVTLGETNVLPTDDSGNGNLLLAQKTTLAQPGTLQSLSFYVTQAAGTLRLGVYDASGPNGGPGKLLAQTNAFTPVVGWNTANVITPVHLTAGTYWLAYLPSDNNLHFRVDRTSGTLAWYPFAFGTMASTFSTTPTVEAAHWSLYATLTPG